MTTINNQLTNFYYDEQIEQFKRSIDLMRNGHPHPECTLQDPKEKYCDHVYHSYLCQSTMLNNQFIIIMEQIMHTKPSTWDNDRKPENRWNFWISDGNRFTIYGPTIAIWVNGYKRAFKGSHAEVELFTRRDENGNIDLNSLDSYPMVIEYKADAKDISFWDLNDELKELKNAGIQKLVEQFCYIHE